MLAEKNGQAISSPFMAPYMPNAGRRGANRHQTQCPVWFARGLTAGRLSLAAGSSARIKCEPYQTSASGSVASPNVFCGTPILSSIDRYNRHICLWSALV